MSVAVITGGTSGLGRVYVDTVVKERPEIDEIWLISRRPGKMEEVASAYPDKKFKIIETDITDIKSYDQIRNELKESNPDITLVIQCAGVIALGDFDQLSLETHIYQINGNVIGALEIPHACIPYMKNGGDIIMVGSTSAFFSAPYKATYCATKTFIRFLSIGMYYELKDRNINVCAVHPGYMDTEMNEATPAPANLPRVDPKLLASNSLKAVSNGEIEYIEGAEDDYYKKMYKLSLIKTPKECVEIMASTDKVDIIKSIKL